MRQSFNSQPAFFYQKNDELRKVLEQHKIISLFPEIEKQTNTAIECSSVDAGGPSTSTNGGTMIGGMPDKDYPNKLGFQQSTNSLLNKIDFANLNFKPIKPFDATVLYIPTLDENKKIIDANVSKINYNIFKNVYMIKNIPAINERPRIFEDSDNIGMFDHEMYQLNDTTGLYEVKVLNPEEDMEDDLEDGLEEEEEDDRGQYLTPVKRELLKRTNTGTFSKGSSINTAEFSPSRSPSDSQSLSDPED